jgi:vacuolar-type H+-ATPase subunit E/Vma4
MSAEKIIHKIASDAAEKIKIITDEADKKVKEIKTHAKKQADEKATRILSDGKIQAKNTKKILITKAEQESKRLVMNEKEKIISHCFSQAVEQLSTLSEKKHKQIVSGFIQNGISKLGKDCKVLISKPYLKEVAEKFGVDVAGSVDAVGGVKIVSKNKTVTLDYTFEGILNREQSSIRVEVGKILFSK